MRLRRDPGRTDTTRGPRRARAGSSPRARSGRGSTRRSTPARRRAANVDGKDGAASRPRAGLTVRAAILAVAVASVALALALPLKVYLGQRAQISTLEQQTREQQKRVDALQEQQRRWADPTFVRAQARERLHFVLPGETAYIVLDSPAPAARARTGTSGNPQTAVDASQPWYSQVWRSVELAGRATPPATAPAKR